ncbi:MAG TPA: hypothetical protein VGC41_21625, partial [Kofleriaceae bacterium]
MIALEHATVAIADCPELDDMCPVPGADRNVWLGVTSDARVLELDLDRGAAQFLFGRTLVVEPLESSTLQRSFGVQLSQDGLLVAIVTNRGNLGVIVERSSGRVVVSLRRDGYHAEQVPFPFAFFQREGRQLAVYAPRWNRLEVIDADTGALLTPRADLAYVDERPEHYLDHFYGSLLVSADGRWLVDNGWVWQPDGVVTSVSLERWLGGSTYEAEDGDSRRTLV